ncbi:MAG: hypothetical protein RL462_1138 [Pseudomonadota bacterium]|jgi:hypothetical protein
MSTPTIEEIEKGLRDKNWLWRVAWANRADVVLTPKQITRGLADKDSRVRDVFKANQLQMTMRWEKQQLGLKHNAVIQQALSKDLGVAL